MKKFFAIALVAASLVACNSGGEKTESKDTTATPAPDTATVVAPDTAKPAMPDTAAITPAPDTTKK